MEQTVKGLVDKPVDAQRIIDELTSRCLTDRSNISVVSGGDAADHGTGREILRAAGELASTSSHAAVDLLSGAAGLAEAMSRRVPGFGMLAAAGRLGASLSNAALGTAEELVNALVDTGMGSKEARQYADALREGRILIVVDAKTEKIAQCARQVMATHGASVP